MTDFNALFIEKHGNKPSKFLCIPSHMNFLLLVAIEMAFQ